MTLTNKTKGTIITKDLKEARSLSDKLLGLLKKDNSRSLLFKTRFGIHTFFLKDPIDVIVLSSQGEVAKVKTLKPNSIFIYNPIYSKVIELPSGTILESRTKVGDTLSIGQK